jgi:hypothetical protein
MKKLNSFEMLPNESANKMYSRLNVLRGQWAWTDSNTTIRYCEKDLLSVLPIDKYGYIVTVLRQGDLSTSTPTQILGKINAHEMYMHITPQEGSSSSKKKYLAFKASHEKRSKEKIVHNSSSDDEVDDASLALIVRKTAKMLKKLNKNGVKFDGKKKFFTGSRRKPISEMDCYNCGELGHLAHQCPKPKKDKYKGKKDDSSDDDDDDDDEKKKNKPYKKKDGKKKEFHKKKKNGKAYIVGDWLTDIESSSGSSDDESNDEKDMVATLVIGSSLSLPPLSPSSSTHLCLMAKGEQKGAHLVARQPLNLRVLSWPC